MAKKEEKVEELSNTELLLEDILAKLEEIYEAVRPKDATTEAARGEEEKAAREKEAAGT